MMTVIFIRFMYELKMWFWNLKAKKSCFLPLIPHVHLPQTETFSQQLSFGKWEKRIYTKVIDLWHLWNITRQILWSPTFWRKSKDSQLGTIIFPQKNACVKKIKFPEGCFYLILRGHIWSSYWRICLSWLHITYKTHLTLTEI